MNEFADTTNAMRSHYHDIELGDYTTGKSSQTSSLQLLKTNIRGESETPSSTEASSVLTDLFSSSILPKLS